MVCDGRKQHTIRNTQWFQPAYNLKRRTWEKKGRERMGRRGNEKKGEVSRRKSILFFENEDPIGERKEGAKIEDSRADTTTFLSPSLLPFLSFHSLVPSSSHKLFLANFILSLAPLFLLFFLRNMNKKKDDQKKVKSKKWGLEKRWKRNVGTKEARGEEMNGCELAFGLERMRKIRLEKNKVYDTYSLLLRVIFFPLWHNFQKEIKSNVQKGRNQV